jgi:hypothetical protein
MVTDFMDLVLAMAVMDMAVIVDMAVVDMVDMD